MGLFVTIEGNDGSGKTTVVECLKQQLLLREIPVVASREPGGIRISEEIRNITLNPELSEMSPKTEALLYAASRSQHIDEKIKPALESGKVVICDRFIDSSLAYQGYARNLGIDEVYAINLFATKGILPDITVFLEVDQDVAHKRVRARKNLDRLELEGSTFQKKVAQGYEIICERFADRIVKIDANRPLDVVVNDVLELILERLNG